MKPIMTSPKGKENRKKSGIPISNIERAFLLSLSGSSHPSPEAVALYSCEISTTMTYKLGL